MPASIKQTTPEKCGFFQVGCYTLHGSSTSPYKAGFLTSGSMLLFPFSYICTMVFWKFAPLLQWPDRSGLSPDSLFWLFRGKQSALYMFNMELYWHHLTTLLYKCQEIRNKKHPIFQNKKIQFLVFKAIHPKQKNSHFWPVHKQYSASCFYALSKILGTDVETKKAQVQKI